MYYPLSLCIGLRYIRAKKKNHFISFIAVVALCGITLGVMALITVLSVLNGFDREIKTRILATTPHITLYGLHGKLRGWSGVQEQLVGQPHVQASTPFVEGQAMISHAGELHFAMVAGVLPAHERQVSQLAEKFVLGQLSDLEKDRFGVALGRGLAERLGVSVGDTVAFVVPESGLGVVGITPRVKRFKVAGIFALDFKTDQSLAVLHIRDAAALYRMDDQVSGLRIRVDDMYEAPYVADALSLTLGGDYMITDWTRQNGPFFATLRMEKRIMFLMLALIVAVAAFNILSTLVMIVTEKRTQVAILRTMGAYPRQILCIFMIHGSMIGLLGTGLGVLLGIELATHITAGVQWLERVWGLELVSQQFYYINFLPSQLQWEDVRNVGGFAFLTTVLATIYPAWQASRLHPAEALRYE